jgi:ADP-ribose pyrophosphatase
MSLVLRFGARDVRVLDDETVWSGHFSMRRLTLQHRMFAGGWSAPVTREVFERGDAVAVLPYDPLTDSLVMIEQFRPGAIRGNDSPWMLELIAGIVEAGESDTAVAHREAMEEAACELTDLVPIATVFPSAGACSEQVRLFCGRVRGPRLAPARLARRRRGYPGPLRSPRHRDGNGGRQLDPERTHVDCAAMAADSR